MWFIQSVNQILATVYRKIRIRDILLKTQDNGRLEVRNDGDTAYATVVAAEFLKNGSPLLVENTYIAIPAFFAEVTAGAAITTFVNTSAVMNILLNRTTTANGDKLQFPVRLNAGTYRLRVVYAKANNSAIVDVTFTDASGTLVQTLQTGLDLYSASSQFNLVLTYDITVPSAGNYYIVFTVTGENASSSAFQMLLTFLDLNQVMA